jgi:teneurin
MVPWNRLVMSDVVVMVLEGENEPVLEVCPNVTHEHYRLQPVVSSTWQHTQLASCPDRSAVIPESQVCLPSAAYGRLIGQPCFGRCGPR